MAFPVYIKAGKTRLSIAKEIREVNRLRMGYEKSMARKLQSLFLKTARQAAKAYEVGSNIEAATSDLEAELGAVFRATYTSVIDKFASRVTENRKAESQFQSLIFQYYAREGASKVRGVAATTRRGILRAIELGETEALGVDKTAKLIVDRTGGTIGRSRAATIARTETHAAASFATDEATRELGLPAQKKRWVSVGDARTRPSHAAANGQEVGIDEPFIIRDKGAEIEMKYPHDGSGGASNNINCRCLAVYFTDEDDLFDDGGAEIPVEPVAPAALAVPDEPVAAVIPLAPRIAISDLITNVKSKKKLKEYDDKINDFTNDQQKRIFAKYDRPSQIRNRKGKYFSQSKTLDAAVTGEVLEHEYGHHFDHMFASKAFTGRNKWFYSHQDKDFQLAFIEDSADLGLGERGADFDGILGHRLAEGFNEKLPAYKEFLFKKVTKMKKRRSGTYLVTTVEGKFDGATAISDIIDAMTSGYFQDNHYVFGHGVSYFRRYGSKYSETFANLFAIYARPEAWKEAQRLFPRTTKRFQEILDEFDDK
jgi:hypothetical protein